MRKAQFDTLVNLSNHPSSTWSEKQINYVKQYVADRVIDIPFPNINPNSLPRDVERQAEELFVEIWNKYNVDGQKCVVHLMGEQSFVMAFYKLCLDYEDLKVCVSTTERNCVEHDGKRTYTFEFERMRYVDTRGHVHSALMDLNLNDRQKDMWRLKILHIQPEVSPYID